MTPISDSKPFESNGRHQAGYTLHLQGWRRIGMSSNRDRKRAEATLRRTETRLRAVVRSSPIVPLAIDNQGRFTLSEGKGLESLGLAPGEIVGQELEQVYPELSQIIRNVERAQAGEVFTDIVEVAERVSETWCSPNESPEGQHLPIDELKIDRSFIKDLVDRSSNHKILATIAGLARKMRLKVVAQGVEEPIQATKLGEIGYEWAQGFLLAAPMPAEHFRAWVKARRPRPEGGRTADGGA